MSRFLIAGGVNTLFGWIIFSGAIMIGIQAWQALLVAILSGIAFNFLTYGAYAFQDMTVKRFRHFVLSYLCVYATNFVCLTALNLWVVNPIWSQLILTLPMSIFSYLLFSRFVFRTPGH